MSFADICDRVCQLYYRSEFTGFRLSLLSVRRVRYQRLPSFTNRRDTVDRSVLSYRGK